jgi:polyphenol oxidase
LNLGFTNSDDPATVVTNREDFLEALTGNPGFPLVTLRQVHSSTVVQVEAPRAASNSGFAEADGMMTDRPGILLGIQTAGCIPVLVADRKRRVVAGFHAGWRGTVKRIVERGLERMRSEFRSSPEDLVAVIGPGIGSCCYEVGSEVEDEFMVHYPHATELFLRASVELNSKKRPHPDRSGRASSQGTGLHLDLVEANRRQLLGAGLDPQAIAVVQQCTSCNTDRFFSYRAEQGTTGRMLSVIGIRPC